MNTSDIHPAATDLVDDAKRLFEAVPSLTYDQLSDMYSIILRRNIYPKDIRLNEPEAAQIAAVAHAMLYRTYRASAN